MPRALIAAALLAAGLLALTPGDMPAQTAPPVASSGRAAPPAPTFVPVAPTSSTTVGRVRRNAQGQIELVAPDPAAAPPPPAAAPVAPITQAPVTQAPVTQAPPPAAPKPPTPPTPKAAAAPAGLPPAPGPVASPRPAAAQAEPAAAAVYQRQCDDAVLLCLGVTGGDQAQERVPLTFGHPLAPKLLKPDQRVIARFGGATLPVQLDQIARHADGSVRFAIFSTVLPKLPERGPHKLELAIDAAAQLPAPPPIPPPTADFRVELETYASQVYELTFGDRKTPFAPGEKITLVLNADGAEEQFTVTISPELAGNEPGILSRVAQAFVPVVAKSAVFKADRDAVEVYEKLWVSMKDPPGKPFTVKVLYGGAAKIWINEVRPWAARHRYVAALGDGEGKPTDWLNGPIVRETVRDLALRSLTDKSVHPRLGIAVGVRQYAGVAQPRFEATIENSAALTPGIYDLDYDVRFKSDDATLYEVPKLTHYAYARWHKAVWPAKAPTVEIQHDRARLLGSLAIPNYDPGLRPSDAALSGLVTSLRPTDPARPLGVALILPYMPTTGGRPDIGPLPNWAVLHALSMDPRAKWATLVTADASGTAPIHLRAAIGGRPLSVATDSNTRVYEGLNANGTLIRTGLTRPRILVDTAHQPSLTYYPYLLTGEKYYLDELHYWAFANALFRRMDLREGAKGLLYENQVRGQAWTLRTLTQAALITPDAHPFKEIFAGQLRANLDWYTKHYAMDRPVPEGRLPGWLESEHIDAMAPWQHDFMTITLGYLADNNVPGGKLFLRWMGQFGAGRFMAERQGFCRASGPGYYYAVTDPVTKAKATTWAQVQKWTWPKVASCAEMKWEDPNADCATCYTSVARAALATLISGGMAEAREPYDFIRTQTNNRAARYSDDPTFAIVPRAP